MWTPKLTMRFKLKPNWREERRTTEILSSVNDIGNTGIMLQLSINQQWNQPTFSEMNKKSTCILFKTEPNWCWNNSVCTILYISPSKLDSRINVNCTKHFDKCRIQVTSYRKGNNEPWSLVTPCQMQWVKPQWVLTRLCFEGHQHQDYDRGDLHWHRAGLHQVTYENDQ